MDIDPETIVSEFKDRGIELSSDGSAVDTFSRSYNVGPTHSSPVYRNSEIKCMQWGLIPAWTKDLKKASPWKTFNARSETLNESRLWKPCLNHHRCVVPVTGYYEWLTVKGEKTPYFIRRKDKKLMFLAGLFAELKRDGEENKNILSFTIVTGPAPENLRWLHDRMPVVLEPNSEEWKLWLDSKKNSWSQNEIDKELVPVCDEEVYEWFKVPKDVGKISINEKRLMEPTKVTAKLDSFFKKRKFKREEPDHLDVKHEEDAASERPGEEHNEEHVAKHVKREH